MVLCKTSTEFVERIDEVAQAVEYVQGIPPEIDSSFDRNVNNLITLDNMMDEATQDKRVSQLFTRGRHDNLSLSTLHKIFFTKIRGKLA